MNTSFWRKAKRASAAGVVTLVVALATGTMAAPAPAVTVQATDEPTASFTGYGFGMITETFSTGQEFRQTFKALLTGRLTRAQVSVRTPIIGQTVPAQVAIYQLQSDNTLGSLVDSTQTSLGSDWEAYNTVAFSGTQTMAQGERYALVVRPQGVIHVDFFGYYNDGVASFGPVGGTYFTPYDVDMMFKVYVTQAVADVTGPTVDVTTPVEGATYLLGQTEAAAYAAQDETGGSGLASVVGDVPNGQPIDTGSVGAKVFKVTATDVAGNETKVEVHYTVVYDFGGFYSPLDNPGPANDVYNIVKAGSAVPAKFDLAGSQGLAIFADGFPTSQQIPVVAGVDGDVIEETVTAGQSGLSYDALSGQYTYVWKTQKSWAKTDRKLIVELVDGTQHTALFRFTR